LEKIVTSIILH